MPQIQRCKNCFQKSIKIAIKALALGIAIMAIFLSVSAKEVEVNLSKDALLNITQSTYELTNEGASYSVHVINEGQILLKNVHVMDRLPPGVLYSGPKGASGLPLLICIEHEGGLTKNLTWYLNDIDTGQSRWVNFTVQRIDPSADLSSHEVRADGMALEYLIRSMPLSEAKLNSAPVEENRPVDALSTPLPGENAMAAIGENISINSSMGG